MISKVWLGFEIQPILIFGPILVIMIDFSIFKQITPNLEYIRL